MGGMIFIGVEEDEENRPVLPVKGIQFTRGLSERITSIIVSNITPPVFPEVAVCRNESGEKAAIVLRVPQSHQAPHAIQNNSRVYIRTGDINSPEELASLSRLGWLQENRKKSIELRSAILERVSRRFDVFKKRVERDAESRGVEELIPSTGFIEISSYPTFPNSELLDPRDLFDVLKRISVVDYYGTSRVFPIPDSYTGTGSPTLVTEGIVAVNSIPDTRIFYTELGSFGLFTYRQPLRREEFIYKEEEKIALRASEAIVRVDEFLESSFKFYEQLGYWGYVELDVKLENILELGMSLDWYDSPWRFDVPHGFSPDNVVSFTETVLPSSIPQMKDDILFRAIKRLATAFGIDFKEEHLAYLWQKVKRR
jgi:hypothetical protein